MRFLLLAVLLSSCSSSRTSTPDALVGNWSFDLQKTMKEAKDRSLAVDIVKNAKFLRDNLRLELRADGSATHMGPYVTGDPSTRRS